MATKNSRGPSKALIAKLSSQKNEPEWVKNYRIKALEQFYELPLPEEKALETLDLGEINYYGTPRSSKKNTWDEIPQDIKKTFDDLGIPKAEQKYLSGVEAQVDSEAIYGSIMKKLEDKGVIFTNIERGLKLQPKLFEKYFGKLVKPENNKFAALNAAVWSGGSFLYVPKGVEVELPLQAYFRINTKRLGQFERTLIIAEEGSSVHYVEGCTAPTFTKDLLHAGVVEIFVGKGAKVKYTTIQNWSQNVYNLVTKKAQVEEKGRMEWVDVNLGSKVTMKYPACYLIGKEAHGQMLSVAHTKKGQIISSGGRMIHKAPNTTSKIISKTLVGSDSLSEYRGESLLNPEAKNSRAYSKCDSLLLSNNGHSKSDPLIKIKNGSSLVEHEASASKLEKEKLLYLRTKGLTEEEAKNMIIEGFIEPVIKDLPMEYAIEFNRLMELEIE